MMHHFYMRNVFELTKKAEMRGGIKNTVGLINIVGVEDPHYKKMRFLDWISDAFMIVSYSVFVVGITWSVFVLIDVLSSLSKKVG